jgi:hypothetical protein
MNLIYTLALVTQTGLTDLAQFQDRDVCMKQALLLKEQAVKAVCVPKTQHTDKEIQKEIDKAMGLMRHMMAQMKGME